MKDLIVIALGGNAIKSAKEKGTNEEQFHNVNQTTKHLAELVKRGYHIVITHGNGPQVGNLLIQHNAAKDLVPPLPMDVCGAQSQGQIGYMIQQTLRDHLAAMNINRPVVTLVTQVEVEAMDQAFKKPTKPVGPFYDEIGCKELKKKGYAMIEDAGRGYRRVVASPIPKHIVEIDAIIILLRQGSIVVACGGGGIPVVINNNKLRGVEAVIDKDFAGELLAEELKADQLMILTDVEKVAINFNTPMQKDISSMTIKKAKQYYDEGHFAPGSMGPKISAAIKFIENDGKKVIITHPFKVIEAINGKAGTVIKP